MIPPQTLEAMLQLLSDQTTVTVNRYATAEEVRRLLGPPMCYEDLKIKKIDDGPFTTTSTSGASGTTTTTTLPPEPLANSAQFTT